MSYLIDTNVISEFRKRRANLSVLAFVEALPSPATFISVMTIGELRKGVAMQQDRNPAAAEAIEVWLKTVELRYVGRTLPVTIEIAQCWGQVSAGRTRPFVDTLLAATALVHNLTLVTRDVRDFEGPGLSLLNPWN